MLIFTDQIRSQRLKVVQNLINIPYKLVDKFESTRSTLCRQNSYKVECDAMIYGSLVRGLQVALLWPRKKPQDITRSVRELVSDLRLISIFKYPLGEHDHNGHLTEPHENCAVANFNEEIQSVLKSIPSPVSESHRTHMLSVSKKQI
jgi:hypothetical protein